MTTNPTAPLSPEREAEIRELTRGAARMAPRGWMTTAAELLAELDRTRAELNEMERQRNTARGVSRQLLAKVTAARIERDELKKRVAELEPRCTCGNAAYEQMYDRRVPCRPDCQMKQGGA